MYRFIFLCLCVFRISELSAQTNDCDDGLSDSRIKQDYTKGQSDQLLTMYGAPDYFSNSDTQSKVHEKLLGLTQVTTLFGESKTIQVVCRNENTIKIKITLNENLGYEIEGGYFFDNGMYWAGPIFEAPDGVVIIQSDNYQ
ncbi:MAG: hypothetical protein GJ680_01140 [Alteromonadaceae bacterium]|nr:hypothetical protein [Alteromonadaceae bacterium]